MEGRRRRIWQKLGTGQGEDGRGGNWGSGGWMNERNIMEGKRGIE